MSHNPWSPWIGSAYAITGRKQDVLGVLNHLRNTQRTDVAMVYAALGEKSRALDLIEEMLAKKDSYVTWLLVYPKFASLRAEPRFRALRQKVGLSN